MDKADHAQTRSYGGGQAADAYRQRQERLINSGDFEKAFAMDVADMMDIAARGGDISKYADAIAEAAAYVACLRKHGKLP